MTNVKLFADSACDLSDVEIKEYDIAVVPLTIGFETQTFKDRVDIDTQKMVSIARQSGKIAKTSAPSPYEFEAAFRPYVEQGIPVMYVGLCSALSSTIANARLAASNFAKNAVYVIDSTSISGITGALLRAAYKMKAAALPLEQMASKLCEMAPHYKLLFTVDRLDFLHRSGRCDNISYLLGSMLGIRPILQMAPGGLSVWKKVRGMRRVLEAFAEEAKKDIGHILGAEIHLASAMPNPEQRDSLRELLQKITGVTKFQEYNIGCAVTCHCGDSVFGFGYFLDE